MNVRRNLLLIFFLLFFSFGYAHRLVVRNIDELTRANIQARPGDTIVLQNGEWKDVLIRLSCNGSEGKPIIFMAETPGKVVITGKSQLKIGGSYIVVQGLYFTKGYSGDGQSVIDFRTDKDHLANHCRVTQTSVNGFNNPKRMDDNDWVTFYGKNNRLDHCSFENKLNMGVLLAVILDDDRSRENFHSIDHNYFGKRLPLASNGGEIIRVGLAQHCQFNSNTQITDNFFEYCDGEAEIISIKSGENIVRGNVFKESQGSVVLRHGDNNTVENNIFWGNGKTATGGVRVINKGQWVVNNFFYKCTGVDFRAPLSIMNGIPNSPAIRYVQVQDAVIANNTFYECAPFSLCEGSDAERTLPPTRSVIANNLFYKSYKGLLYNSHDKLDGIRFAGNVYSDSKQSLPAGFVKSTIRLVSALNIPAVSIPFVQSDSLKKVSESRLENNLSDQPGINNLPKIDSIRKTALRHSGAMWYKAIPESKINLVMVDCSTAGQVYKALKNEKPVHIRLTGKTYDLSEPWLVNKPVKFTAKDKSAIILSTGATLGVFVIGGGGRLELQGLNLNGEGIQSRYFICNDTSGAPTHYNLSVINCHIDKIDRSKGCQGIFYAHKSMVADSIVFRNNQFKSSNCDMLILNSEKEDRGYYGAEQILIDGNAFLDIQGRVLDIYRGGSDESTLGPQLYFRNNKLTSIAMNENLALINLVGVQVSSLTGNVFNKCNSNATLISFKDVVRARHTVSDNIIHDSGTILTNKFVSGKTE